MSTLEDLAQSYADGDVSTDAEIRRAQATASFSERRAAVATLQVYLSRLYREERDGEAMACEDLIRCFER